MQIGRWSLNRRFRSSWVRWFLQLTIGIVLIVVVIAQAAMLTVAQDTPPQSGEILHSLQPHPLPESLAQWQPTQPDDYFSQISSTPAGYLIWSEWPVKVFIETVSGNEPIADRAQQWISAVTLAVQEWNTYLPLMIVESPETADIRVWRRSPPLSRSGATGVADPLRARSAETRYELFVDRNLSTAAILAHRCQILLRPGQTPTYIQAAARHELGHALGIWGHSPLETDALYFSQVRNPAAISFRDVNTLKRIYEQPTRLGWSVEPSPNYHP